MADKLVNGDYAFISGTKKLQQCDYIDELLQRVYMIMSAGRERFYPDKDYGLTVLGSGDIPLNLALRAYAQQAVDSLDGVYIISASQDNYGMRFNVKVNDTERTVIIRNENNI